MADDLLRRAYAADLPTDETAERILGAAIQQAEDFGLRRFTIDEVARRVGISRVTVYRYFPKKDQLLNALLMRELRRFLTKVDAVIAAQRTPEDKLVEGLVFCLDFLRNHRVLNRLLRTEPELILPLLTTKAGNVLAAARGWIAGHIRTEIAAGRLSMPDEDVEGIAELIARNVLSLVLTQDTTLPIDSPDWRQRVSDLYLGPIVRALRP
ncbi:TetR/AcrR family transcriptional regulator [Fodinicola acaciae]|uniref:TetR/AcrR family transcriptional regulator n=1 Tax=Fodinicola acaciae TaxID=2681555 RepID=UPI0013CF86B2|nr:TetR/AcrR family transcriptional regulator [Fodinicola acaciae]